MEVGACGWVCWEKETDHDTGRWPVRVLRVCVPTKTFDCEVLGRAQHGEAMPWSQFASNSPPHSVPYEGLGTTGEPSVAAQVPRPTREAGVAVDRATERVVVAQREAIDCWHGGCAVSVRGLHERRRRRRWQKGNDRGR